jgi:formylglycine-generating enzyme required for sulfatase activity/Leucine-rich repeat (LRR) protein
MWRFRRGAMLMVLAFAFLHGAWVASPLGAQPTETNGNLARTQPTSSDSSGSAEAVPSGRTIVTNSIGMKLVLIPAGEFEMGSTQEFVDLELNSPASQARHDIPYANLIQGEIPRHKVRITEPFWLGATEVTQQDYERVMGNNPSHFHGDPRRPVERVSWDDSAEFCRKLSALPEEKAARRQYQLPTEAQWEYACRAGNQGAWCFSRHQGALAAPDDRRLLGEYAWFGKNSGETTHPGAQKKPNAWGLYDMYGNVSEWCRDWYREYPDSPAVDPVGTPHEDPPGSRDFRALRGGAFYAPDYHCRSALRNLGKPEIRREHMGFRVSAVTPEWPPAVPAREQDTDRTRGQEHSEVKRRIEQEKAIAMIDKLGGEVTLDEKRPEKSVIGVEMRHTKVTDGDLEHLIELPNLQSLDLSLTEVTDAGLERLKELTNLQLLDLSGTNVTGAGLEHLKGLANLQSLELGGTKVTDAGLKYLEESTNVQSLNLSGTEVTDAGLDYLKGLTNLQSLALDQTAVTDAGLEHLKGLTNLQSLYLGDTAVIGVGLEHLKGLAKFQWLSLRNAKVSDTGLQHIKGLAKLKCLYLGDTEVTDAGLRHLEGLTGLQWLDLKDTRVTDAGLEPVKRLTNLQSLILYKTKVTDEGVNRLHRALPKCEIQH